ncbi:DUF5709 domain-containing protein [Nocardioides sp.]|uniref:DUF5709 domain-containing protein n=1 Tax=Nocardioides sp. TaxID=35761 RepID=UPI002B27187A|nr:DUF5709 domain-containing protein [Nocardioides sp.]
MSENDSYGDYSVDGDNQLTVEDSLADPDVADALDRGYSAPEHYSPGQGFGNTPYEEASGESFDQRLAQEEPDLDPDGPDPDTDHDEQWEEAEDSEVGTRRAGRLVDPDQGLGADVEQDLIGRDVGIDGAAASAEEAAMHIIGDS